MTVKTINGRGFASNTYILISGQDAAVVDPSADVSLIREALGGARLSMILLTHGHFDHILHLDSLRCSLGGEILIHREDARMICDPELNASAVFGYEFAALPVTAHIEGGQLLSFGREQIEVIHTPGHTRGSVCYLCGDSLICGDTLFSSGYGRYDLPGGDRRALFDSLKLLSERHDNPTVYPGHGGSCRLSDALIIRDIRSGQF